MPQAARAKYSMFAWNRNQTINFSVLLRNTFHGKVLFLVIVLLCSRYSTRYTWLTKTEYFIFSYVTQVYLLGIDSAVILYS